MEKREFLNFDKSFFQIWERERERERDPGVRLWGGVVWGSWRGLWKKVVSVWNLFDFKLYEMRNHNVRPLDMRRQPLARETSERFSVRKAVVAGWLGRTCYASNRQDVIESELPH